MQWNDTYPSLSPSSSSTIRPRTPYTAIRRQAAPQRRMPVGCLPHEDPLPDGRSTLQEPTICTFLILLRI